MEKRVCELCRQSYSEIDELCKELDGVMEARRPDSLDKIIGDVKSISYTDIMRMSFMPRTRKEVALSDLVKSYRVSQIHTVFDRLMTEINGMDKDGPKYLARVEASRKLFIDLDKSVDMTGVGKFKSDDEMLAEIAEILRTKIDGVRLRKFIKEISKFV